MIPTAVSVWAEKPLLPKSPKGRLKEPMRYSRQIVMRPEELRSVNLPAASSFTLSTNGRTMAPTAPPARRSPGRLTSGMAMRPSETMSEKAVIRLPVRIAMPMQRISRPTRIGLKVWNLVDITM